METFIKEVSVQEGWAFAPVVCRFLGEALGGLLCAIEQYSLDVSSEQSCLFLPLMSTVLWGVSHLRYHVWYILTIPWKL